MSDDVRNDDVRNMDKWLGDSGMPVIADIGGSFDSYGKGWSQAAWAPTRTACNPFGIVHAGTHGVMLDAAMNFAVNTALTGKDRARATLNMSVEYISAATPEQTYTVRGEVVRTTKQVAFAEATVRDADGRLVSRATGTFLLQRAEPAQ